MTKKATATAPQTEVEHRSVGFVEVKTDDADAGSFSGYGSVFGNVDSYGDVIERGAFKATLAAWGKRGKLPPMLLQHGGGFLGGADDMLPIGAYTAMREDRKGLYVEGRLFAMQTERGQYLYEGMKSGALDGLSIGFVPTEIRYGQSDDEPDRTLLEIDLWEVSVVTFPANSAARVADVKTLMAVAARDVRGFEAYLRDVGKLSRREAAAAISCLRTYPPSRDAMDPANTPRDEAVSDELEKLAEQVSVLELLSAVSRLPKLKE